MPYISSANIACGGHAGDPVTMRKTILLAIEHGVAIGAHPGFADKEGFGRREMRYREDELFNLLLFQIGAIQSMVQAEGSRLQHVKPHGALYNLAARDPKTADVVAKAIYHLDTNLILVGLAGSELIRAGKDQGLRVASEVFADRRYTDAGFLVPRSREDAVIHSVADSLIQVENMVLNGKVNMHSGHVVKVTADTICLHGDHVGAVEFALAINGRLKEIGVSIEPVGNFCN